MLETKRQKFTFKCSECGTIFAVEFEDENDIEDIRNDELQLECPCGPDSRATVLRN